MKKYNDRSETPLTFHKFFWWVVLPLSFLTGCTRMNSAVQDVNAGYGAYATIDVLYYFAILGLIAACFIGFFQWKSYAWYCVILILSVNVVYGLYGVVLYAVTLPDWIVTPIAWLIISLIYAILIGIYYIRRRPLFFPDMKDPYAAPMGGFGRLVQASEARTADPLPKVKYCTKCGAILSGGGYYCSECGAPVQKS